MITAHDLVMRHMGGNRTPIYKVTNGYEHKAIFTVYGLGKVYKTTTGIMIDIAIAMILRGEY